MPCSRTRPASSCRFSAEAYLLSGEQECSCISFCHREVRNNRELFKAAFLRAIASFLAIDMVLSRLENTPLPLLRGELLASDSVSRGLPRCARNDAWLSLSLRLHQFGVAFLVFGFGFVE